MENAPTGLVRPFLENRDVLFGFILALARARSFSRDRCGPRFPDAWWRRRFSPSGQVVAAAKIGPAKGIEIATKRVPGKATDVELEFENGRLVLEVEVFADGKVFEVEIDAETGQVLEVEEENDDEGEEDDD